MGILPEHYGTELYNATLLNDAALMQLLIAAGAPVDQETADEETLLHTAAAQGLEHAARVLVMAGLSPEQKDRAGITPMQRAILHRQLHMPAVLATAELEKNGILPQQYTDRLITACLAQDFYTAHLIHTAGHSINTTDATGRTALLYCAEAGKEQAVQFLLARGADATLTAPNGQTPLCVARANGHKAATGVLAAHALLQLGITEDAYDSTLLHAAASGDTETATLLHEAGANPKATDADGNTPMHLAVMHNHSEMVAHLYRLGGNINARNAAGMSPLYTAIAHSRVEHIELLHRLGAKMNLCLPDGRNPLQFAVTEGYHLCIVPLAQTGADVNKADSHGNTLLHFCAAHGQQYCMQALLQAGANVHSRNKMQLSALHYACAQHNTACAQILIEHGAVDDIYTAILADDEAACRQYLSTANVVNKKDGLGCGPLHWAARFNRISLCILLLEHGADATATDTADRTPGDYARIKGHTDCMQQLAVEALRLRGCTTKYTAALQLAITEGDSPMLRLLIDAGADVEKPDKAGWPALHLAVKHNKPTCIAYLLHGGANAQTTTATGYTALHLAVSLGHTACTKALLDGGADADARLHSGCTALHLAARLAQQDCMQYLLAAGANVNLTNYRGDTPLLELARWNWSSPDSAALLIQAGADLNAVNIMGENAIHAAAISGNKACLALFISAGVNTNSATNAGKTPRELAKSYKHKDCEALLKEAETDSLSAAK